METRERRYVTHKFGYFLRSSGEVIRRHDARTAPKEWCVKLMAGRGATVKQVNGCE
jgi:hypothetical protein